MNNGNDGYALAPSSYGRKQQQLVLIGAVAVRNGQRMEIYAWI
jgi:hypothetical protein